MTTLLIFALGILIGIMIGVLLDDAVALLRKEHVTLPTMSVRLLGYIGLILSLLLSAGVGALLLLTRASASDYYSCMADWQQQAASATRVRAEANEEVQNAMDRVMTAVVARDTEQISAALKAYVSLRTKQNTDRKEAPYPDLPDKVCGEPEGIRR